MLRRAATTNTQHFSTMRAEVEHELLSRPSAPEARLAGPAASAHACGLEGKRCKEATLQTESDKPLRHG